MRRLTLPWGQRASQRNAGVPRYCASRVAAQIEPRQQRSAAHPPPGGRQRRVAHRSAAGFGRRTRRREHHRVHGFRDRHRPDERQPPRVAYAGEAPATGERRGQARRRRRDEPRRPASASALYEREVSFYRELAPRDRRAARRACHLAVLRRGRGLVHARPRRRRGRRPGRPDRRLHAVDEARLAMRALARLHAPGPRRPRARRGRAGSTSRTPLNQALLDGAAARLPRALRRPRRARARARSCERLRREPRRLGAERRARRSGSSTATTGSTTCCSARRHRLPPSSTGRPSSWGPAMLDAAYFLGGGAADRGPPRARGGARPRATTTSCSRSASRASPGSTCWDGVPPPARSTASLMAIVAADARRAHRARRRHVHGAARAPLRSRCSTSTRSTLLPEPARGRTPLRPDPADEGRTRPGPRRSGTRAGTSTPSATTASLGVYVRLGRLPEPGHAAWYTACIVRPGPADGDARRRGGAAARGRRRRPGDRRPTALDAEQHCEEPLQRFRVTVEGTGEAYDDPSALAARRAGRAGRRRARPDLGHRRHPVRLAAVHAATRSPAGCTAR